MGKYLPTGKLLFKLPFMSFGRIPARFIVIFAFCVAVLSAAGLQRILTEWRSYRKQTTRKLLKILAVLLLILIILLAIAFLIPGFITNTLYHGSNVGKDDLSTFFTPVLLYSVSITILIAIFMVLGKRFKIKPEYIALFFIAVAFAELAHYNHKILKPRYAAELADGYVDLKSLTNDQNDLFRINGVELKHQLGLTIDRVDNARGYEALKNRYFHDITRMIRKKLSLTSSEFYYYSLKLSRLMNVKYQIVKRREKIEDKDFIPKANIDLRREHYKVYSSMKALPRAYFTSSVYEGESLSDFYNFVVADKYLDSVFYSMKIPSEKKILLPANIIRYSPANKLLSINAPVEGILILSEAYFPGWKVTIDNSECELLRVNYAFMGVKIQKGMHIVNFCYHPSTLNFGIIISFITLAGFIVCLLRLRKNNDGK